MLMNLILLVGCSEYNFEDKTTFEEGTEEVVETPAEVEVDTAEDLSEDTGVETSEPSDDPVEEEDTDLPVAGDGTPSEDYCTEFSNFDEWSFFGDGNWYVDGGILYENRGGFYASVAYMYDFGNTTSFEISVDTGWQGNLNDLAGFVFNLDPVNETYWLVRIDDPQGDYGRYNPTGRIEVASCNPSGCRVVAHDDSADLYVPANETFVSWGFTVQNQSVNVFWNGQPVFSQTVNGLPSIGTVGLYSNDNDGGVIYDNFCVYSADQ